MSSDRIADMTIEELKAIVRQMVAEQVERAPAHYRPDDVRPTAEVLQSMRALLIKPAPAQPSAVQMLLEERDRWNSG